MPRPNVGDRAPDFTLPDAEGRPVRLAELLSKKAVVLYFYPKDETPGCTAESCAFRDAYDDFTAAGAEVVGVSRDDGASHGRFAAHHKLPFVLLADPQGGVHELYGIRSQIGIPARPGHLRDRPRGDRPARLHVDDRHAGARAQSAAHRARAGRGPRPVRRLVGRLMPACPPARRRLRPRAWPLRASFGRSRGRPRPA